MHCICFKAMILCTHYTSWYAYVLVLNMVSPSIQNNCLIIKLIMLDSLLECERPLLEGHKLESSHLYPFLLIGQGYLISQFVLVEKFTSLFSLCLGIIMSLIVCLTWFKSCWNEFELQNSMVARNFKFQKFRVYI